MGRVFKYANNYAFLSNPVVYICCLLLYLVSAVHSFVLLGYTEYNVNAAYYLITNETSMDEVIPNMIGYLVVFVFFQIVGWLQELIENKLIAEVSYHYHKELNEKLSSIKWEYFETQKAFLQIQECRVRTLDELIEILQKSMFLISIIPMLIVYGYYLSRINLLAVFMFLGVLFIFNKVGMKIKDTAGRFWQEIRPYAQRQKYYFELCGDKVTHQEYQFHRLYKYFLHKWEDAYEMEVKLRMKIHKKMELCIKMAQSLFYIPRFLMLLYITYGIMNGRYEIGFFVMANTMLANISNYMAAVQEVFDKFRAKQSFITAFQEVMGYKENQENSNDSKDIEFQQVVYKYPQSEYKALDFLSLKIKRGEKVAVVGENGSGKTTSVNLILSLADPQCGVVKRRNINHISSIIQDFTQYEATIKENIMFGCPERRCSDDEIWELIEAVDLTEKVRSLPKGIHTKLGQLEKGIEFSKGQWQRLAIARLLANREADVWILDEPTAYLDPISEIEIYELIYKLAAKRSVLFISHRLGFAKRADRVIVFQNGKIIEDGTHQALLEQEGTYAKMYHLQEAWNV